MWAKASKLDVVYRKLLLTKFFTKGWGTVDNLKRICEFEKIISDRSRCQHLVDKTYPVFIDKNKKWGDCRVIEGHFLSPFAKHMKGIMPKEVETARFQFILPLQWGSRKKPVCIHLAGTGDHGFWRRRTIMARPLLKEYGIASILLENPFYGLRKPKEQLRSSLLNVSDLFVMGGALILETLTLLHWCEKEGYGPLGVSGVSMGGHMATLAATNWHRPIPLVPCLSWSNATPIFTHGVLSGAIPWNTLAAEYVFQSEYEAEILRKLMRCPQYNAYTLGKEFATNFPDSMDELTEVNLMSGMGMSTDQETPTASCPETSRASPELSIPTSQGNPKVQSSTCNIDKQDDSLPDKLSPSTLEANQQQHTAASSQYKRTHTLVSTDGQTRLESFSERTAMNQKLKKSEYIDRAGPSSSQDSRVKNPKWWSKGSSSTNPDGKTKEKQRWKPSKAEYAKLREGALHFMEGVMDAATFVGNFSKPVDPELVLVILAQQDAYIPWRRMPNLEEMWLGMEVRYVNSGHVAAILFKQHHFRKAIYDTFQKAEQKYPSLYPEN